MPTNSPDETNRLKAEAGSEIARAQSRRPWLRSDMPADRSLPTRASLLERLKDLGDDASWNEFYQTYRELIYSVARKAGLNESEAEEVVQDTVISVAKKMPDFRYDPAEDSFKGWLLTVTRWRILDQLSEAENKPAARHIGCFGRRRDAHGHDRTNPRPGGFRPGRALG